MHMLSLRTTFSVANDYAQFLPLSFLPFSMSVSKLISNSSPMDELGNWCLIGWQGA